MIVWDLRNILVVILGFARSNAMLLCEVSNCFLFLYVGSHRELALQSLGCPRQKESRKESSILGEMGDLLLFFYLEFHP
jgi:hypothetical protein